MTGSDTVAPAVLLLDCDGVMQEVQGDFLGELARLLGDQLDDFMEVAGPLEHPALEGREEFEDALVRASAERGWPAHPADLMAVWLRIEVDPEVLELAAAVRRGGTPVWLATNQHRRRSEVMHHDLGYAEAFDGAFYSWQVGARKPQPAYFEHVVRELGRPAHELLFVDDRHDNVDAARAVGLRAEQWHRERGVEDLARLLGRHGLSVPGRHQGRD